MVSARFALAAVVAALVGAAGCNAIIDLDEGYLTDGPSPSAGGAGGGGTGSSAGGSGSGAAASGGSTSSSGTGGCTTCGGDCVELATDANHCGACERSCLGQDCKDGLCVAQVLSTQASFPLDIRVRDSFVYWTNRYDGAIRRVPAAGGTTDVLVTGEDEITGLAVDDDHLYWVTYTAPYRSGDPPVPNSGKVRSCAIAGCAPDTLADTVNFPFSITLHQGKLVFGFNTGIRMMDTDGGNASTPQSNTNALDIVSDGTNYLWTDGISGGVRRGDGQTVSAATCMTNFCARGVAVADGDVFYTFSGNPPDGAVYRAHPIDPQTPAPLATNLEEPYDIAVDDEWVYWTVSSFYSGNPGSVWKARRDGSGTPVLLADKQSEPRAIAVDGDWVYWATYKVGGIRRVPK